jgi:cupin fold WbuC family metalloprotein
MIETYQPSNQLNYSHFVMEKPSNKNLLKTDTFRKCSYNDNIKIIMQDSLDSGIAEAATLERKRAPILIHSSFEETPQRFVNCLDLNTYVRPHVHVVPKQWELMCWLSGEIVVYLFDDSGVITSKFLMNEENARIIEIPPFRYHAFIATKKSSYLEIRNGHFTGTSDRIYAPWAPAENSIEVADYQKRFSIAQVGDRLTL